MKTPKKKKSKDEPGREIEQDDDRPVPFGALAELTSSDVIAQVKMGMSNIEPLELNGDIDGLDGLDTLDEDVA